MKTQWKNENPLVEVVHEPGNCTRYVAQAYRIPPGFENAGQWQVLFPYWGTTYHFNEGNYLALSYMIEKMGIDHLGRNISWPDLGECMKIIAAITKGKAEEVTDSTGHLTEEFRLLWLKTNEKKRG